MLNIIDTLTASQDRLYNYITNIYSNWTKQKGSDYVILGRGTEPKPMLCVHLDTINTMSRYDYDVLPTNFKQKNNLISLTKESKLSCLGGDDRAGVWIALHMLEHMILTQDYKYDIGFFKDEEVGCFGSSSYKTILKAGIVDNIDTTCYIGLDRRSSNGTQEVAVYGYDNQDLIGMFEEVGYKLHNGSVSDCSNLAGDVACVNLSVGYDKEHTTKEVLYTKCMNNTLDILKEMEFGTDKYLVEEEDYSYGKYYGYEYEDVWNEDAVNEYVYDLEQENKILRDTLRDMGFDVDKLLKEEMYYSYH